MAEDMLNYATYSWLSMNNLPDGRWAAPRRSLAHGCPRPEGCVVQTAFQSVACANLADAEARGAQNRVIFCIFPRSWNEFRRRPLFDEAFHRELDPNGDIRAMGWRARLRAPCAFGRAQIGRPCASHAEFLAWCAERYAVDA